MEQDLTRGSVPRQLIRFSLPLLGANLLQSLYNIVDMAVVGRFVGSDGLAAVSSAVMLCYIITSLCSGVTMGGSVLVAQYKGAGDARAQGRAVGTLFTVSALSALVVTAACLFAYRPVFALMNVPAEALGHACAYMEIIAWGGPFLFGFNAVSSVLRGLGDSRSPLLFVAAATVVNVALDLVLVGPLGLGTAGAAWATVAAQAASFLTAALSLRRRRDFPFDFRPASFRPDWKKAALILRIGLPSAVQMAVLNLSYLLVTGMLNAYGVVVAAAAGVGLKVNSIAALPCWAVGTAVTTMAGQCAGAGDRDRAARACKMGVLLAMAVTLFTTVLVQLFTGPIVRFFDSDPAVVAEGVRYLRICCSFNCLIYAGMYVYDAFATGVACAWLAMLNSILQSVAFRLSLSYLLGTVLSMGYLGIFWAEALSPLVPAVVGAAFFHSGRWRRRQLI